MRLHYFSAIILGFILTLAFQNCSKVGFQAASSASSEQADDNGNLTPLPTPNPGLLPDVVKSLEPTLAIRGVGCVTCHAKVDSNVVTDFGNGSPYYFAQNKTTASGNGWWNSGSPYGNHGNGIQSMNLHQDKTIYVPKAVLPQYVSDASSGAQSLFEYVKGILSTSPNASTKAATVVEMSSVYIGAPADSDLIAAFGLNSNERIKTAKSKAATVNISGFVDEGNFFRNSSVVYCDGDVVLRGPLYLKNLHVATHAGCRLYVIGSVFIDGPIIFDIPDTLRNLQITSTRSISMGLGMVKKDAAFCEPTSNWAQYPGDKNYSRASSLLTRYADMWTVSAQEVRAANNPVTFQGDIIADAGLIENKMGTLYDAACTPEGRNVSFERILLNAPVVNNRYYGQIKGTIIAEYALMSLNSNEPFNFVFDPVFKSVDVLPYLNRALYLSVQK